MYRYFFLCCCFIVFTSCERDGTRDLREYYFPLKALTEGLVYEYEAVGNDSLAPDYWYYRTLPTDSAYYFTKAYYRPDFQPGSLYREQMVNNGILLRDLFLFETDSTGKQQRAEAEVISANTFPFIVREDGSEVFIYHARFQLPSQPRGSTAVLINRRFAGDTTFTYEDRDYPAVTFTLSGSVDQRDSLLGAIEPRFTGREIYAEGLGLVFYARDYGNDAPAFRYRLARRFEMEELEEMARPGD